MFLQRLDIYTRIPSTVTSEMMEIVVRIMAEVLSILGIVMKDIKQGRISEYSLIRVRHCWLKDVQKSLRGG